ncbi:type VI secretion system protein TssA [Botrimarina sp.]|uniref:type VI secretion system protein TssA n=1 Tax=Botrimarina sp. TaxID=2795802 RepID=UPI0032EEF2DA
MATAELEPLIQPLPGDDPMGDASHFAMVLAPELRELRREEAADEFNDATRPTKLKKADWAAVAERCDHALREHAKDLRTACHLVEARTRLEGLRGLAGGLELVARLVDEAWERLSPPLGDDPLESRATPLANLLDDPDRGVCFPSLLRTLPLLGREPARLSYTAWTRARGGKSPDEADLLSRARAASGVGQLQEDHAAATAALYWVDTLRSALEGHFGEAAPALLNLRSAVTDLRGLLADELGRLGYSDDRPLDDAPAAEAAPDAPAAAAELGACPRSREELYALLDDTAERLRAMEPHSPIPYLVKRAVRLGRLPFPSLIEQLIREPSALSELSREFGIADPDGTAG